MAFLGQLLSNGVVVFGTTVAIVLGRERLRERHSTRSSTQPTCPPRPATPALQLAPSVPQAPVGVESDLAETLLVAATATPLASATAPEGFRPFAMGDRAVLLRQMSISHMQAVHPVFCPGEVAARARPHAPSATGRPEFAAQRPRAGTTRPSRALLHLVRPAAPVPAAPLP